MTEHRRLSDKIIAAHEQACKEGRMDVAQLLVQALELDISSLSGTAEHRQATEELARVFERQQAYQAKMTGKK